MRPTPLTRFCAYGFLKNQRYFEPFLFVALMAKGSSFFEIGLLIALRELTVNLVEIPSGAWADGYGRRRAMLTSFAAYIASFAIFGTANSLAWFALAMVAYGVGDAFRTGTHKAMIFDWLRSQGREEERTEIYGYTRSWSKRGSAVSGLVAAAFVFWADDLTWIFWAAIPPYLINAVNLLGYPDEVDGPRSADGTGGVWARTREQVREAFGRGSLRALLVESMGFEGLFHAVKDYLQPLLLVLAVGLVIGSAELSEVQRTAVLVGPIYALLHLLSSAASRRAHRFAGWAGGEESAARRLWAIVLLAFAGVAATAWWGRAGWMVLPFVVLHVAQNLWRPVLIARLDARRDEGSGATLLSVESQSRRVATMLLAPLIGWLADRAGSEGSLEQLLPVGVCGFIIAAAFALRGSRPAPGASERFE